MGRGDRLEIGKGNLVYWPFKIIAKKCLADEPLAIPLDEIQVDDTSALIEKPMSRSWDVRQGLKQSRILIVKEVIPLLSENHHRERTGTPNVAVFWQ
ncbi:hypothetical protein Tco_0936144 [Tanacetum coccineum]